MKQRLAGRIVRYEDLTTAVVAACLADRVRTDHRTAVGAADELQPGKHLVDALASAGCSADLSFGDCHLSIPSVLFGTPREPPRRAQHRNVGPDRLRTPGVKSTAGWGRSANMPTGRMTASAKGATVASPPL